VARLASLRPSGGPGRVDWPREQVESGTCRRLLGGGHWNPYSSEQVVRPRQHAGVQARWVWREALGVLRWQRARAEQGARRRRQWRPRRGSVSRASRGEGEAFIARHRWRRCATDGLLPGTTWGAVWLGYDGAWAATFGGHRASGVRRRHRPAPESTARGSQGEGRKGRFDAIGSHRARTDGHWPVSMCQPGGTAAVRTRHGAGARDADATVRTRTFPISAYPPLTNNFSNFCN
jgi:hypothetical protein